MQAVVQPTPSASPPYFMFTTVKQFGTPVPRVFLRPHRSPGRGPWNRFGTKEKGGFGVPELASGPPPPASAVPKWGFPRGETGLFLLPGPPHPSMPFPGSGEKRFGPVLNLAPRPGEGWKKRSGSPTPPTPLSPGVVFPPPPTPHVSRFFLCCVKSEWSHVPLGLFFLQYP